MLVLLFSGLFGILIYRVFYLQIVREDYYLSNYIQTAEREVLTAGTRGLIYDRNGQVLAYNKLAYAVEMEDIVESSLTRSETLNSIINKTVHIIKSNGDTVINDFSIIINSNGQYEFSVKSENEKLRFLSDIYGKKSIKELDDDKHTYSQSTAEEVMKYLCSDERFIIDEKYTKEEKLYIAMIRFNLSLNSFQKYISTKIASNVSQETVAAIYESAPELKGVSIQEETIRVYNDSTYFSHILGYTGKISEDQLATLNSEGGDYTNSDMVGKSGIEQEMETTLQGTKGKEKIFVDSTGNILDSIEKTDAVAGNNVYLTIDAKLQKAGYTILEQKLAGILYSKIVNHPVTVTEDSKEILIPVTDVYYQLINNNVIDLTKFSLESSSENEKHIFDKFSGVQDDVINTMYSQLTTDEPTAISGLSEEYKTYSEYIYTKLSATDKIIDTTTIDTDDEKYKAYKNEQISLQEFLYYAISKNWINTSRLFPNENDSKYSSTDEIYGKLIDYTINSLKSDSAFSKKIYYYLIYNGIISGNEVCMALYDQKILEYDEGQYTFLRNGGSSYDFIREQIRLIKITPAQLALDPCSGSLVVTDVDTGDVLALVTYPSYDNNMLSGSVDSVYWNKINNDLSLPLYNRATQTRTAPGSTFKMVSAITGLEEGVIGTSSVIVDQGKFTKVDLEPKCWKYPGNHGAETVSTALRDSCNYFFYEVGYRLSVDQGGYINSSLGLSKIKKYADMLGLTSLSGVEIEENSPMFSTEDAVRSAIGQGSNSYSNIQLARYVNTIANHGNNYQLTLLDKVVDSSSKPVEIFEPKLVNTVDIQDSTWNAVYEGMRLVCTGGTARSTFSNFQIPVAGKSGTAQENKLRSNHSVFVAFAPYEEPEIAVSVLLVNGESSGYTAEIVRDIIKYYYNLTTDAELFGGNAAIPTSGITAD